MLNFNTLKSRIESRYSELKGCGANKPGGGGFSAGNTCARGGGSVVLPVSGVSSTKWESETKGRISLNTNSGVWVGSVELLSGGKYQAITRSGKLTGAAHTSTEKTSHKTQALAIKHVESKAASVKNDLKI